MNQKLYHPNWSWDANTEKIIRQLCTGSILNFPCGMSQIGLRVDVDRKVKPAVIADLDHPPFKKGSFETVLCDPPFSMFARFRWISGIADLATKKLILCTLPIAIRLSPKFWRKQYFITEQAAGKGGFFIRIWQIFTKNQLLEAST